MFRSRPNSIKRRRFLNQKKRKKKAADRISIVLIFATIIRYGYMMTENLQLSDSHTGIQYDLYY